MFLFDPKALMVPISQRVKATVLTMAYKSLQDLSQIYCFSFPIIPLLVYSEVGILTFLLFTELATLAAIISSALNILPPRYMLG